MKALASRPQELHLKSNILILGQSTGMAVCIAINDKGSAQDVEYGKLEKQVIAAKQR